MVQVIKAKDVTLNPLTEYFKLQRVGDKAFFPEWQNDLPELDDFEKQSLNEIKEDFFHLSLYPILEPVVKMVVLSPLLRLAQFYRPPFDVASEQETEITSEDEGTIVHGNFDLLVFEPPFWVAVIESKRADLSLAPAIPQVLAYMLSYPEKQKPCFGIVTNGDEFRFIKLVQQHTPQYAVSDLFALDSRDDIEIVLKVLKRLAQIVSN
ncbi:hypothetical protein NIES4071_68770 [Calothrix sp. NIES-4071]|nr:hypothetical protein NIES4071_68770 [Calothrix sp. NIES-4071]BAZ61155.1 hypothetical protein NIES4105_68730 [Calothrix sp. NIES-4105]